MQFGLGFSAWEDEADMRNITGTIRYIANESKKIQRDAEMRHQCKTKCDGFGIAQGLRIIQRNLKYEEMNRG
jgi:hypothetical protein